MTGRQVKLKNETVAVHGGYEAEPTTKAVAVPIYQTVAYEFDSADHGAALFNLEVEGHRYTRISNPTTEVLERRVAALEGGIERAVRELGAGGDSTTQCSISPGWAATSSRCHSSTEPRIRCSPMFCQARASVSALPNPTSRPRSKSWSTTRTRAIFCESVGNPAGNICDIEALAAVAARHGIPLIVDNTVATPILLRPIEYGADIVVLSLTKFMGGHGTTLGGAIVDSGRFPVEGASPPLSYVQRARRVLSRLGLHRALRASCLYRALPQRLSACHRLRTGAALRFPSACRGSRR